ncbi:MULTISPECIES: hypothetical protein [unclassified Luteococcus]|uniref:hypothetical protein n=1 Tax=unclassified Luteococcus TaxID=2639923 RepID=UPI00313AB918
MTPLNNPQIRNALLVRPREIKRPTVRTSPVQPLRRTPTLAKSVTSLARKIAG